MWTNKEISDDLEDATEDQLNELRRLGVPEKDLEGLSAADAEDWIDELRCERANAGKFDKDSKH